VNEEHPVHDGTTTIVGGAAAEGAASRMMVASDVADEEVAPSADAPSTDAPTTASASPPAEPVATRTTELARGSTATAKAAALSFVTRARVSRGRLTLTTSRPGARVRYRIATGKGRRAAVVARGTVTIGADGRLAIRLTRRAKRALARAGRLTVSLTPQGAAVGQRLTIRR
jgi:hypothetical protein